MNTSSGMWISYVIYDKSETKELAKGTFTSDQDSTVKIEIKDHDTVIINSGSWSVVS